MDSCLAIIVSTLGGICVVCMTSIYCSCSIQKQNLVQPAAATPPEYSYIIHTPPDYQEITLDLRPLPPPYV